MRRLGVVDGAALDYTCQLDPPVGGSRAEGLSGSVLGSQWREVHFVRTAAEGREGQIRLVLRTARGWFMTGTVLSLAAGQGSNVATELRLYPEVLVPAPGHQLSATAGHRFVSRSAIRDDEYTFDQSVRVACALREGAPECLRVRTRWRSRTTSKAGAKNAVTEGVVQLEFGLDGVLTVVPSERMPPGDRKLAGTYRWFVPDPADLGT